MPMWRCPHCGTPQAEAARCWVCRRSSTSCGTCRHFRRAVAANLGYCGLDRARRPLAGDELRGCWQEGAMSDAASPGSVSPAFLGAGTPLTVLAPTTPTRLEFVEVPSTARDDAAPRRASRRASGARAAAGDRADDAGPATSPAPVEEPRWSFWGELDR